MNKLFDLNKELHSANMFTFSNASLNRGGASVGGWVELGRTTLDDVAGDSINVSSLADKRYYMILGDLQGTGAIDANFQFNSDTGSTYANRRSTNGGADSTGISQTNIDLSASLASGSKVFQNAYIANKSSNEKLVIANNVTAYATGAGTAPIRDEVVGKWANTSNAISSIQLTNTKAGSFDTGSEVVVLGWDESDTHTTNFWEELASVDAAGGSATLSTGTFTAKKYLWVQVYGNITRTGGNNLSWRFNSDTGSNYSSSESEDGSVDSTRVSQTQMYTGGEGGFQTNFNLFNFFIINNSANEKCVIVHQVTGQTNGAANAPHRYETVHKWANTSTQITSIQGLSSGGTWDANSKIRVWGSD